MSRGCTTSAEQLPAYCNQNNINNLNKLNNNNRNYSGHRKRDTSVQVHYNIECCTGDYCNAGDFPELPPIHFNRKNLNYVLIYV